MSFLLGGIDFPTILYSLRIALSLVAVGLRGGLVLVVYFQIARRFRH
jgi:hypothetical protein